MCQLLLSDVGYVPTPNVHSDVWDRVESYTVYMLLACRLKITFVQLQHLLLPSLIVTSSQVRAGMPLPLRSCCISGLGPEGLLHNPMILVWSPGNLLRVTLAPRGNSASSNEKLNGRSAVSTRLPTSQHSLEKQVTSSQELCSMRDFLHAHLHDPEFFLVHE